MRLLTREPPPSQEAIRTAATAAGWTLPRGGVAVLVAATAEHDEPGEALLDSVAARLARRLGEDAVGAEAFGAALVVVPDPDAPGRRRRLESAAEEQPVALGPTVPWTRGRGRARAGRAPPTRSPPPGACPRRRTARRGSSSPRSTSRHLLLAAAPDVAADLAATRLAPLDQLAEGPRARLEETLAAWLDRPGQVQAVAAAIGVHPQTVRYRVRQLRDLFGERLEDPEARFELSLALRARGSATAGAPRRSAGRAAASPSVQSGCARRCYQLRRCGCS